NRMVELVFDECGMTGNDLFKEAQRRVRWHYQWVVAHDFLPRIIDGESREAGVAGGGVVGDILRPDKYLVSGGTGNLLRPRLHFYHWREQPFLPVEFSVAAYRFGHSMVRPSYFINDFVRQQNNHARIPLFSASDDPLANLTGFRPLPERWGFQWKYFFELEPDFQPQLSYKIDTRLSTPLGALPGQSDMANLARRNLTRALRLGLPSGQNVARAMGIEPLSDADLDLSARGAPDFEGDAPLWFYVLREAELLAGGQHLGPVGGRIVAEVLIGLLMGDPLSWLNIEPDWQPTLAHNGRFGMAELIDFASGLRVPSNAPRTGSRELARWRAVFG
ncbi:MAG: hypothetical protein JO360_11930, partial [Acidobacteria bacterium]|nr:hypothetical protein [Acidobacteriota bacterium]